MGDSCAALNKDQARVVDLVRSGRNVFITGSGGTGKSFLVKALVKEFKDIHLTATTGVAAVNIGGRTIHSWAGIGLGRDSVRDIVVKLQHHVRMTAKSGKPTAGANVKFAKRLVIDEISMMDRQLFSKLDVIFKEVRGSAEPFGGIQLILVGDFFQLPPVNKDASYCMICGNSGASDGTKFKCVTKIDPRCKTLRWDDKIRYVIDNDLEGVNLWEQCGIQTVELGEIYRQSDMDFVGILQRIRTGQHTDADIERLVGECGEDTLDERDGIKATHLYTHNVFVDVKNAQEYAAIEDTLEMSYRCNSKCLYKKTRRSNPTSNLLKMLNRNTLSKDILDLKVGAQVMLIANIDTGIGLCNGTRGTVVGFKDVHVKKRHEVSSIMGMTMRTPQVKFYLHDGTHHTCNVTPWCWELETSDEKAQRIQIPLIHAWAISVHKSQGATISKLRVNLGSSFTYGQVYVALSRATGMRGHLHIASFDPTKIMVHPHVVEFYNRLNASRKRKAIE